MARSRTIMDLLGAVSPGAASIAEPNPKNPPVGASLVPGVVLGVGGFAVGRKLGHPVLGFLGAEALGLNAYRFYRGLPGDRTIALTNVGAAGSAIAGSLLYKRHPFWGWVLGATLGIVATSFVPGSNAARLRDR